MAASAPESLHKDFVYGSDEVYQNICDLCIQDNQSVEAKAFCSVCTQYLCTTCYKSHTRANATKKHKMLTGKDMPASQRSKFHLKPACSKHPGEVLESLCYDHKAACCAKCKILDHRYCKNLVKLSELSLKDNSKEENELKMTSLKVILNKFIRLEAVSEILKSDLESERKEMIKTIRESRKIIDDKLDILEADMITKVNKEMDTGVLDLDKQKKELNCLMDELKQQVNEYEETFKTGSAEQVIVMSTMMESEVQKYNAVVYELHGSFYKFETSLSLNKKLEDILCHIRSFGDVDIVKTKVEIQRSYDDRQVVYLREVDINLPSDEAEQTILSAVEILSDGGLLLCDELNCKVKVFDSNYTAINNIKLTSKPCGMALMTPTDITVSLSHEKCLQNLKINQNDTLTLQRKHQTELKYSRILKYKNNIIALGGTKKFYHFDIIDTSGRLVRQIRKEPHSSGMFPNVCYLCLSPDNSVIYITDDKNGCIGISVNGDVVLKFTDETTKGYTGVCIASGEFLYVSACESNTIMMIKSNGEKVKELLRLKGLKPGLVTYSKDNNIMLVKVAYESVLKVFSLI